MPKLEKGQSAPLNVTQKAKHRFVVGLGWDPAQKPGIIQKAGEIIGGKKTYHDLDLACYLYDGDRNFLDVVSSEDGKHTNPAGTIYHSGDDEEGIGGGDDEQISVELKNIDPAIHHIVFKVTIKSGHSFDEIDSPEIRIADGYSDHSFFTVPLNHEGAKGQSAYIFMNVFKGPGEAWHMRYIDEYLKKSGVKNWPEVLADFTQA